MEVSLKGFVLPGAVLGLLLLGGCAGWEGDNAVGLRHRTRVAYTGAQGKIRLKVPLVPLDRKMLMTVRTLETEDTLYIDRVEDENGNTLRSLLDGIHDVAGGPAEFWPTGAIKDRTFTVFNWPIDEGDPLLDGDEIIVTVAGVDAEREHKAGVKFQADVLYSDDDDMTAGDLAINVHYTGEFTQDPTTISSIEQALDELEYIFQQQGISVVVHAGNYDDESTFARPGFGTPGEWEALSGSTENLAIDLVIVDSIAGSQADILGAAGSIPGPLQPSERSGVIISSVANAGPDLTYSDEEVKLLGATMSHEIGHQLGLFHPVELSWERWDMLDDTERCQSESECVDALGYNLMYPIALCSVNGCLDQTELTPNQAGVLHRNATVH